MRKPASAENRGGHADELDISSSIFPKNMRQCSGLKHNTWRTAGPPPQSLTAVTMSAEEKKGDEKDKQINLKVKDQVRGRLSPRASDHLPLVGSPVYI